MDEGSVASDGVQVAVHGWTVAIRDTTVASRNSTVAVSGGSGDGGVSTVASHGATVVIPEGFR